MGTAWIDVAVGVYHTCAIRNDSGNVPWCWGRSSDGQLGNANYTVPLDTHPYPNVAVYFEAGFSAIFDGERSVCAIQDPGYLWCWGLNDTNGGTACLLGSCNLIGNNGVSYLDGADVMSGTLNGEDADWQQWDGGYHSTCGLKQNGDLYCAGYNLLGVVGPTVETYQNDWALVGHNYTKVAVTNVHACGLKNDGTIWCWGSNGAGQLGVTGLISSAQPVQMGTRSDWVDVTVGLTHSCGVTRDGEV